MDLISVKICENDFRVTVENGPEYFTENWRNWENGESEKGLFDFIKRHADPNAIFFDVGAWLGVATLASARLYSRVYAFEADPVSLEDLKTNVAINAIGNVTIVGKFVGDSNSSAKMYSTGTQNSSGSSAFHEGGQHEWDVETIKFDRFIEDTTSERDRLVLKIDIEGAEYICFHLLKKLVQSGRIRAICLSLHPFLLAKSVKGQSIFAKIRRRLTVLRGTIRVYSVIRCFNEVKDAAGTDVNSLRFFSDIVLHGRHRSGDREIYLSN